MGSIETGERIAALRKAKEWSQSELGEKIGLTQATVSEIERGVKRGSVESLEAIADALDTDIGYLLTGRESNGRRCQRFSGTCVRFCVRLSNSERHFRPFRWRNYTTMFHVKHKTLTIPYLCKRKR